MLEFMSCARPVILGVDGQARQIVEDASAGMVIEPENPGALVAAIEKLNADPGLGRAVGQRGREYIAKNFSRANTAEKYIQVLNTIVVKP
jgi:glycosyltransferase involved in cell wall biosynthesis